MFVKILDALTFTQWIKTIGIVITTIALFGLSKDSLPVIMEKLGLITKPPVVQPDTSVAKINPSIPSSDVIPTINLPNNIPTNGSRKVKVKINIEYEVTETHTNLKSMAPPPPPPVKVAMAPAPPPPVMLAMIEQPPPSQYALVLETKRPIRNLISGSVFEEKNTLGYHGKIMEDPEKVESFFLITSLWDIYCLDPDFSTECKANNHD